MNGRVWLSKMKDESAHYVLFMYVLLSNYLLAAQLAKKRSAIGNEALSLINPCYSGDYGLISKTGLREYHILVAFIPSKNDNEVF